MKRRDRRSTAATERLGAVGRRRPARRSPRAPLLWGATLLALLASRLPAVAPHGYLMTPRSRNLVAYQDMETKFPDASDPKPEDCPHCLNRGGNLAQCGILFGEHEGVPWERNYDEPLNVLGEPMPANLQGVYREGGVIEVEVMVTTHHKGHFEFSICPIDDVVPMPIPTEECFAMNKLKFISDELYGAPKDPNYPERAYIVPASKADYLEPVPGEIPVVGARYKMKFRLPRGVAGDLVLLQWYYLTANSCKHEGYADYAFPEQWGDDVKLYPGLPDCGAVPPDGNGIPEQFWNCAEIKIVGKSAKKKPASAPAALNAPTTPQPTSAPTIFRPCLRSSFSAYYEATEDCTGYYVCAAGVQGQEYECAGGGMLYDEVLQRCNWAAEVDCGANRVPQKGAMDEAGNPLPTASPTPVPPNRLLEWPGPKTAAERGHNKTIIAYYASWQWYDRNGLAEPKAFDWNKITRATFAFFQITTSGDIFGTDMWADPITLFGPYDWMAEKGTVPEYCSWDEPGVPPNCMSHHYQEGLIYLAHQAGAEVYPSIGGWSLSDPFPAMAANAGARKHFASQCVELIKSYDFDGIDIDWEYPGYEPHSGTPADTKNYNLLLNDVRGALDELEVETGKFYGLTAALPCGPTVLDNMDINHVGKKLTELNLMTYDFHGSWNEKTGVNAPLYDQEGSPEFSVQGCVNNWLKGGAPQEKINIGFPFYGRSFLNAKHLYEPHEGNDESTWHVDEGVPQYYNIMDKISDWTSIRDDQTMTQYMYGTTGMVSFDDERAICDKTEYAQIHDLNGYIIWEISGDLMPDLSTPLLDAANAKLLNPGLDCADYHINVETEEVDPDADTSDGDVNADASNLIYYPQYSKGLCKSAEQQPESLQSSDLHDSAESCCDSHFSWKKAKCLEDSLDPPGIQQYNTNVITLEVHPKADSSDGDISSDAPNAIYYPAYSKSICKSDGQQPDFFQPSDLHDSAEACCDKHFSWNKVKCLEKPSQTKLTNTPAKHPTNKPSQQTVKLSKPSRKPRRRPSKLPTNKQRPSKGKKQQIGESTKNQTQKTKQGYNKVNKKKSSFTIVPQSALQVVEYTPVPNKDKEKQTGDSTKNQIQKAKKGQEKGSKKKKEENENTDKKQKKNVKIKVGKRKQHQKIQRKKMQQKKSQRKRKKMKTKKNQ